MPNQVEVSLSGRRRTARRRGRRLGAVLVLAVAGALLLATVGPSPGRAMGPLPSCDLGDVYTDPRGYGDWSVTLVDRMLRVGADYVPPDLVHVSTAGLPGGGLIRAVAVNDTRAMAKAAKAAGAPIGIWSAYRSFGEQTQIFNGYVAQYSYENAITYSQRPGHSEHQLGLGVDFMSAGGGNPLPGDWAKTPAGSWMQRNSWRYGWVLSYPRGTDGSRWNDRSCFRYEPWHYRYLGREVAAKVHASGLTIREYLWKNHTLLDGTGRAASTATTAAPLGPSPTSTTATPTMPSSPTPTGPTEPAAPTVGASSPVSARGDVDWLVLVAGAVTLLGLLAGAVLAVRRALSRR